MLSALHEDVTTADTEYGMVLLDQRSGRYFQLSRTAAVAVRELSEVDGVELAVAALTERFEVSEHRARADVAALLRTLTESGLVRP